MKQQTAVEWLEEQLLKGDPNMVLTYIQQAKQIEQEQREKNYSAGYDFGFEEARFEFSSNYNQDTDEWD